ncbi:MAG: type II toxin-antitoxin system VapC family toxin [Desulfovermiculus sp.]|nr:type II toxin-antitoxin system VapC family toxin [Desulfovermiculus sp.]
MDIKILLDTSAYVAFKRNHQGVVQTVVHADVILISPVVLGELFFGFRRGSRYEKNMQELDTFLAYQAVQVTSVTRITADRYSRVLHELKSQGTPIPTNDVWIAAQTLELGAELITLDQHFNNVPGLPRTVFEKD